MQLEIEKLEIDIASLRSSVEKKAAELQTASNELRQTDGDQERRNKLEVGFQEWSIDAFTLSFLTSWSFRYFLMEMAFIFRKKSAILK